jgi:hypothetical protein
VCQCGACRGDVSAGGVTCTGCRGGGGCMRVSCAPWCCQLPVSPSGCVCVVSGERPYTCGLCGLALVLQFLVAGHETTSNALAWAFFALDKHPEVEKKLREEVVRARGCSREGKG